MGYKHITRHNIVSHDWGGQPTLPGKEKDMKCPKCKGEFKRLLALSRKDNKTQICDKCGSLEENSPKPCKGGASYSNGPITRVVTNPDNPRARTEATVKATGNKWAMENFNATHN